MVAQAREVAVEVERGWDSGYILKVEPTGFADGLEVE